MHSPAAPSTTRCSTINNRWSISTNEEEYNGVIDTVEESIAEGKANEYGRF
jgi:hypothetical protein